MEGLHPRAYHNMRPQPNALGQPPNPDLFLDGALGLDLGLDEHEMGQLMGREPLSWKSFQCQTTGPDSLCDF